MVEAPDFDSWYRDSPDPFEVRTRWYERRKLSVLLASLQSHHYRSAWDPACGTGDLTLALAQRCDDVLASDVSARAVRISEALTTSSRNVEILELELPCMPPVHRRFDLVVLSEVMYYLQSEVRAETIEMITASMHRSGPLEIVSVHWRHHPHDAYLSGVQVTDELDDQLVRRGWVRAVNHDDSDFVLCGWTRSVRGPEAKT